MLQRGPPSSETRRRLKAETSKVASVHLHLPPRPPGGHTRPCSAWGAIRAFQWCPRITVTPSIRTHYMLYLEKKKFYVTTGTRPRSESFFICLSNTLQELQSGDFRGSFSFFQLWLQRMSCMLTLKPNLNGRKSEWRRNRKWREGGERSDKDRLQICVAVPPLINRTFDICLCPYSKDTASVFVRISHKPLRENHLIGGIKKIVWCRVHQLKKQRNSQSRKGRT